MHQDSPATVDCAEQRTQCSHGSDAVTTSASPRLHVRTLRSTCRISKTPSTAASRSAQLGTSIDTHGPPDDRHPARPNIPTRTTTTESYHTTPRHQHERPLACLHAYMTRANTIVWLVIMPDTHPLSVARPPTPHPISVWSGRLGRSKPRRKEPGSLRARSAEQTERTSLGGGGRGYR